MGIVHESQRLLDIFGSTNDVARMQRRSPRRGFAVEGLGSGCPDGPVVED